MIDKREKRRRYAREVRLERLRHLRHINAPLWVIKSEQIALVMNRDGMKFSGAFGPRSKRQQALEEKHMLPVMGN
jgi:hypothetical protein